MKVNLLESASLTATAEGKYEIRIIGFDVQGTGGFYSKELAERDVPAAFPKGTKIYFDHGEGDRSVRPVRDLAGRLISDPYAKADGMYAKVQFNKVARDIIEDMHEALGMSIKATGDIIENEHGRIVTRIHPHRLNSVDIVTEAGADGTISEKLEEEYAERETVALEEKDIAAIAEAVVTALAPAPKDEVEEVDFAAVAESAFDAGLPKSARLKVVEAVKSGTDLAEAIKAEKEYIAEISESVKADEEPAGKVTVESKVSFAETWAEKMKGLTGGK